MDIRNDFTMGEVEEFWDSAAAIYEQCNDDISAIHNQRFQESIKFLALEKNSKILNIWSRTGMAVKFLRSKEADLEITNAEISTEMISLARARFPDERFDKVDLLALPYADNYFDEILSLETLEHVSHPLVFLKELYRVIRPGGRLLLSVPPETAELALKVYEFFFRHHGEGPHKFISSKSVKKLLTNACFKVVLHRGTLLFPLKCKFIRGAGEGIIRIFQNTFIAELGIRQFYLAIKQI